MNPETASHSGLPDQENRTVHVVDDDAAVRDAIVMSLQSAGLNAVGHPSAMAFLNALPSASPNTIGCVVTDVRMPDLDGIGLLQRLRTHGFPRPVIVMTGHGDISTAVQAMKAGAADFIEKPFDDETLLAAIENAAAEPDHEASIPGVVDAARRIAELSVREREVLNLLAVGKPNKLIAYELGISPRTAEAHRARMMARLGVQSLAEAIRLAFRAELSQAPPTVTD